MRDAIDRRNAIDRHKAAYRHNGVAGRNSPVRRWALSLSAFFSFTLSSLTLSSMALASELNSGDMAPNFTLKSVQGDNQRLGEYAGNVRALLFTASWCGNCTDALRELQTLHTQLQPYGFSAWAISLDNDPAKTRQMARQLNIGYPMLIDNEGRVAKLYWIDDLPALFLLDRDGRIRQVLEGDAIKNTARIADTLKSVAEE